MSSRTQQRRNQRRKLREERRKRSSKKRYNQYAADPVAFCREVLGKTLTDDQVRICEAVRDSPHVAVPSSHGQGKTAIAAWLVLWWVYAVGGLCITSAPTGRQVKELLWGEIRKARSPFFGQQGVLFERASEEARAYGFSADNSDPNAFQGVHAEKLLIVLDEACGISPDIADGAIACATGSDNKILEVGNPVKADTPFQASCADPTVAVIRLPAWRHPNVSWAYKKCDDGIHRLKPDVAAAIVGDRAEIIFRSKWPAEFPADVVPGAISIEWIEAVRRKHGEGSPYWLSRVEAQFPTDGEWSLIPRSWFLAARGRYDADPVHWDAVAAKHQWRHGVDVGDGGDPHGFATWRGPVLYATAELPTLGDRADITRCTGHTRQLLDDKPGQAQVDVIGVGSGVQSTLQEAGYLATAVNWGKAAKKRDRFANLKAEQCWEIRELFRLGEVAVAPLGDEVESMAAADLSGVCYIELSTGKLKIEEKKLTRKRLGRSPNVGDAIILGGATMVSINPMLGT